MLKKIYMAAGIISFSMSAFLCLIDFLLMGFHLALRAMSNKFAQDGTHLTGWRILDDA